MRIFRRKPKLKHLFDNDSLLGEKKFVEKIVSESTKRFKNINTIENLISSNLNKDKLQKQSIALSDLITFLYSTPRGRELAEDMYVAGYRAIHKLNQSISYSFCERLDGLSWSKPSSIKIEDSKKFLRKIIEENSNESKFFNLIKPVEKPLTFPDVKIACLFDRFTFDCFSHEVNLIPISKTNWRFVLSQSDVEYFFAESIWSGHDGGWQFAMSSFDTAAGDQLREVLSYCKENKIKTIFWNKEDPTNFDSFIDVAKQFDYIFTSDEGSIGRYVTETGHENVWALPFAAQPIIHNPIRNSLPEHDIGFAGSWYSRDHGNRKRDTQILLDASMDFGLHIFDRNYGTNSKNVFPGKYSDFVKGSLSYKETCMAYRAYKIFLNVNSVVESPTMFSRRVFELLSSYTNVISTPSAGIENILGDNVHIVSEINSAKSLIERLLKDDFYRKKSVHKGYRLVHNYHKYSDRLKYIFERVGITWNEAPPPLVSCVTCSNRPQMIDNIIRNFDCQNYSNKELILMLEADNEDFERIRDNLADRSDVSLFRQSKEEFLGTAINRGIRLSGGEYIAKFDDDDIYGPNYLSDGLIPFSFSDASVVGKLETILYHEASGKYYIRFPGKSHRYLDFVMGATIIAKKSVFDVIEFGESNTGEDSEFLKRCKKNGFKIYSSDPFNWVHMRHKSEGFHTWQVEDESLLRPAIEFDFTLDIDRDVNI